MVLTRYDGGLAAIGMLLVAPRFGRRGLGRRLMMAALDHAGNATVFLYATAEGRPLYEALGFREVGRVIKYAGEFQPGPPLTGVAVRSATTSDLPELARLDAAAFGATRRRLLARLDELATLRYVAGTDHGLSGYGAAWPSPPDRTVIGPLIAADDTIAEVLLDALARQAGGILSIDLPPDCERLARWACGHGLRQAGDAALMVAGGRQLPGARGQLFAPLMQALG